MVNLHRQLQFFNPDTLNMPKVTIIGCGGIGSYVAYYLAQMGVTNLTIWDRDIVAEHNISNQNFTLDQIGTFKVDAIKNSIIAKIGEDDAKDIIVKRSFFNSESKIEPGIIILATDNIDSRKLIYDVAKESDGVSYLIDGRLGGELIRILSIDMESDSQKSLYEDSLFASGEAEELPCTAKAIIYVAARIASEIVYETKVAIVDHTECRTEIVIDYVSKYQEIDNNPFFERD